MGRIWDISPTVGASSPVFPGDRHVSSEWTFRIDADCPVNVAALTLSPHVGAHADAPLHFVAGGTTAAELPLDAYLGPCRVVHALAVGGVVGWRDVEPALADPPERVLIRTYGRQPTDWDDGFTALSADLVERLGALGVLLVGTDAASLDPASSKDLPAHHAAHRHGMAILENLLLDEVSEGDYELVALPIKLAGLDAAPVRAILREVR
ncbi:MAG: arylformamidase [Nocardioidaceae bacterium]|nr:arylformamidase [Nocardioidaceae bacterium]MCL2613612.1 arylformamidase [Nocardioidaceae bacterium]